MKTAPIITIAFLVLWSSTAGAVDSKDFYSDGNIMAGEQWNIVSIYDTPPEHTTVDMLGGTVDWIRTYNASTVNITNGMVNGAEANGSSVANISGGIVDIANAYEHGTVNIIDNDSDVSSVAFGFGTINVRGGSVKHLYSWDSTVINVYAGTLPQGLGVEETGTINLHGGVIEHVSAAGGSVVNVYGYDLGKSNSGGSYGYGQIYGYFMDDSPFAIDLYNTQTYSHINLIPEPATVLLLGLGGIFLKKRY